ncbi:hypothetical protein Pflav_045810 [Phytohabitans flavus]|uniref:Hemopexin n=1 Tax=Phytohabitans flavus TaxID=1076124 RepID=A0A6F8XWQ6_9ACTN|nr:hemopexin repeat-containing protein [Phytohabitans flavus]BCB78171.1 hypothetical protein Pflav_045810 [Phytohabitans flavus]
MPAEFEGGVEAAFADASRAVHLFKDGRTVTLRDGTISAEMTARRWGRLRAALPGGKVDAALVGQDGRTYLFSDDLYVRYSGADYSIVDAGYPRRIAGDWGGLRRVDAAFVADGATHLFGAAGALFDVAAGPDTEELDAGRLSWRLRQLLQTHGIATAADVAVTGAAPEWTVTAEGGIRLVLRRDGGRLEVSCDPATEVDFHVRYSTKDYAAADPGYPRPLTDNWWNLPEELAGPDGKFASIDAVLTARDGRTYLFNGGNFIVYDSKRRWWSEPKTLAGHWDSVPFTGVDAAFVGVDGRTYMFFREQYARYSTADYNRVDDRYPASITPFWGNVVNNIARTGRVDAALVAGEHTYLFSGDQFVRYTGSDYSTVDIGYPRKLTALAEEPRLRNLRTPVESVTAAFADRGSVYLFSGDRCHAVSSTAHRRYDERAVDNVRCALVEDGMVYLDHSYGWYRYGALEGDASNPEQARPRLVRSLPQEWQEGSDAILRGTDGNTYLFQGSTCVDVDLGRAYPLAEEWGRPRNAIYHDNAVDAAFVGVDGRTYVFRDDQFVVYTGDAYSGAEADGGPRVIAEHWGGLRRVALAYVRGGVTYLFEPAEADGTARYVAYSGTGYDRPDEGYPRTADASFWELPDEHRPAGFTMPTAVLASGNSTLVVTGGTYLAYNEESDAWSYPRPLERIWRGIGPVTGLVTAFTGRDGATYFFFANGEFLRHDGRSSGGRLRIDAHWARTRNNFLTDDSDVVNAALVHRGVTYLFSGDQYVRYSGPDYRYVDPGYPKPIVGNIRTEKAFAALPAGVEDDLAERYANGSGSMVDAAVSDRRTVYLFVGRTCHAISDEVYASHAVGELLGKVRNNVADLGRVDAALVAGEYTYLFSGDQYVRYTGTDYRRADDAYPKTIAAGLSAELELQALPEEFHERIDAAFREGDATYLFAGKHYVRIADRAVHVAELRGVWGLVHNEFHTGRSGLDAAFMSGTGELYAFAGGQYARYAKGRLGTVEDGYPRRIRDDWGDLPQDYERGVEGAFRLGDRTYLTLGEEYVRYSGERFDAIDRTYPQPFRYRWSDAADYRLSDLHTIARFAALARNHRDADGGLAAFVLPGRPALADPYAYLAELFGWDAAEVTWCRRNARILTGLAAGGPDGADGDRLELEFLLEMVGLFELAGRLGTGPSRVHGGVWTPLHGDEPDPHHAADALYDLIERGTEVERWPGLARELHDELNLRKRDVLLATVLAGGGTSRDLFARLLVDVDMGARGNTSRVREAIAAVQLYLHRYLLNLELAGGDEQTRQRVKQWWQWMRNYRVWEANRKVFLYPENYLRPELRAAKTPAFAALEGDLLQGEITAEAVERAYKRYLDEYTEVSRLTIAGGYVYTKDQLADGPRRLVLFGRTRTDPRRYYFRRAEFADRQKLSGLWEPWQPVDVRIDADHVHPVHAFGRVFVFWVVSEKVPAEDQAGTTVVAQSGEGGRQTVSGQGPTERVRIFYSFQNLTKEWAPAQTLGTGASEEGTVSDITLRVAPRMKDTGQMSIVVSCSYSVTEPDATESRRTAALFELNPELYSENLPAADAATTPAQKELLAAATDLDAKNALAATTERVAQIFVDPVDPSSVVRFDAPAGTDFWFSVDHKGGSFLCRPARVTGTEVTRLPRGTGNPDRLPDWPRVHAAFELGDGARYFFHNDEPRPSFSRSAPEGWPSTPPAATASTWGRVKALLPAAGDVTGVFVRGQYTYVICGEWYVRFTGTPFGEVDPGYPMPVATNQDYLPPWTRIDVAFAAGGREYFFATAGAGRYANSNALAGDATLTAFWGTEGPPQGFGTIEAAVVDDTAIYLRSGTQYLRFRHSTDMPFESFTGPLPVLNNGHDLPTDFTIGAGMLHGRTMYWFDNNRREYHADPRRGRRVTRPTYLASALAETGRVDAAWLAGNRLYLTTGTQYVRYTIGEQAGWTPSFVDEGYPKELPWAVQSAFRRDNDVYLFSGDTYVRIDADQEPSELPEPMPVAEAWGGLPQEEAPYFDAALDSESGLYMFVGEHYIVFPKTVQVRQPYEVAGLPFEIIRLTAGTASTLSQKLLTGGVPALLDLATQETDEVAVTTEEAATGAIRVKPDLVDETRLPTGSHLDFRSANGLYYWEIFFHAPFLIAQALNGAQRFEDAKRWYEYVFDPTNPDSYWRFLPFLVVDLDALAEAVTGDLAEVTDAGLDAGDVTDALRPVLTALRTLAPAVAQNRDPATEEEREALLDAISPDAHADIAAKVEALAAGTGLTAVQGAAVAQLREHTLMAADLARVFDALGDRENLLKAYREDPFDPHAIADLRPVAYRRAVVMRYIDNLLDWGDLLFRQYTPESVDEARMLYVLAYDLLGERGNRLGTRMLPATTSFSSLDDADLIGYFTSGGTLATGTVHAGVASTYFHIPGNDAYDEYRARVEDRLVKIRQSLNIMGISQPLPLFAPPIDPAALVSQVAAGGGLDGVGVALPVPVPHQRFAVALRRAQELTDKLRQLGETLLSALERGSAEELGLLQRRQEQEILAMTRAVKEAQVRVAEETVAELTASLDAAQERKKHYEALISTGMSEREHAQIGLMATAATVHYVASVLKVAAGFAYAVPEAKFGPFIIGVESGGRELGASIDKAAETAESLGEAFSMTGEALGVQAQHDRMVEDWELQVAEAQADGLQLEHRIAGANQQLAIARAEAGLLEREIAHGESVAAFLRDKFTNVELYSWMSGELAGLYFQAYNLAHEAARAAERAFQFEQGVEGEAATFIRPAYWQSRRGGLLAGDALALDLERLAKAQVDGGGRGLEITRQVSLRELDPLALLRLRDSGSCEFALTEALFDGDFPGHYRRQIRTVTVTFQDGEGEPLAVPATLTQLGHKTVLAPDPQAVRYLLDPQGTPPAAVRSDWRVSQQIALSEPDYGRENNGLFELRFDDERYLPFEGTGAVSRWRLERGGRAVRDLFDVVVTVKYSAEQGGPVFANAVRGLLKPYPAARFFDLARDFPDEWSEFVSGEEGRLVLPFTPEMFPDLAGPQIGGIYPTYELENGSATRLVLGGDPAQTLTEGKLLPTPGLAVHTTGAATWTFTVDGPKENLLNAGLVLTYQARVH